MQDTTSSKTVSRMFGLSLDSWNSAIVVFGLFVGIFSLLAGGATYIAFQLQKREAQQAAENLERFKLDAGKRIAEANARASDANLKAEAERVERLKLEEKLAPRSLSGAQQDAISKKLAPLAMATKFARQHVSVFALPETDEGTKFSRDILGALNKAGWSAYGGLNGMIGGLSPSSGVVVRTSSNPISIAAGAAVVRALLDERIAASVLPDRARGCEEEGRSADAIERAVECHMIAIAVREHP